MSVADFPTDLQVIEQEYDSDGSRGHRAVPQPGRIVPGRGNHRRSVPAAPPAPRDLQPAPGRRADDPDQGSGRAADCRSDAAAGADRRRFRGRQRTSHHPAEHAVSISCRCGRFRICCIVLADVRLTTREACYNTVRNVTACPLAGLASRRAVRRAAVRAAAGIRVPAQGIDRQSAAQVQGRVFRLPGGLHGDGDQRCRPAGGDSGRRTRFPHDRGRRAGSAADRSEASARVHSRRKES